MESIKIVVLCVVASVGYGVVHDQVTLRVCLAYFTVGHPPVFSHLPDTLHAAAWGVVATWWVGLLLGLFAALACRAGAWPKLAATDVLFPLKWLLVAMAGASIVAGVTGYLLSAADVVRLVEPFAAYVSADKHDLFLADGFAHGAAYAVGTLGGIAGCGFFVRRRRTLARGTGK